jgi:hypothetical protein
MSVGFAQEADLAKLQTLVVFQGTPGPLPPFKRCRMKVWFQASVTTSLGMVQLPRI